MKNFRNLTLIACLLLMFASCKKEDALNVQQPVGLGGDSSTNTAIDQWIYTNLTVPYNISAIYKWDPWTASLYNTITPADESKVIPLFTALRDVWINPYNTVTGSTLFMKKYTPKQIVLLGSVEYNFSQVLLGQAEGGNNIVFFDVNQNFDKNPVTSMRRVIKTAHHEFAHILHQNIAYPVDFKGTSSRLGLATYTSTWYNVSAATALANGYASNYSMVGPDDDFVEMVAVMLSEGKNRWEEIKASTNATARQALQIKEDFIVNYYRQAWNIDFYALQTNVQAALNTLFPPAPVADLYGFGKTYTRASVNPLLTTLLPQPAPFLTIYNAAKNAVPLVPGGFNLVMDSMAVVTNSATTILVRIYMHQGTATTVFQMDYTYSFTKDAAGVYTFTYVGANANGAITKTAVQPLLDYFNNNKFTITWFADPNVTIYPRVKFTPQSIPGTYFIAHLKP